jgi:hypothetical protein
VTTLLGISPQALNQKTLYQKHYSLSQNIVSVITKSEIENHNSIFTDSKNIRNVSKSIRMVGGVPPLFIFAQQNFPRCISI